MTNVNSAKTFDEIENSSPLPLTAKEKAVLCFIESFLLSSGISPSYQEIKVHFGFASLNSVQNYLKQLSTKGYLKIPTHQKRAIQILHSSSTLQSRLAPFSSSDTSAGLLQTSLLQSKEEVLSLPLMGKVAAGRPLESLMHNEFISIPPTLVRKADKTFALLVRGDSMIEEGIFNGDTILVQQQSSAANGDLVVATINEEATVKRFFLRNPPKGSHDAMMVELRPANEKMQSMWFSPYEVNIQGIVVGLIRKF